MQTISGCQCESKTMSLRSSSIIRVCVSWVSGMETVAIDKDGLIEDLADAVLSAPDVPAAHKLFIYRGFLLDKQLTVDKARLHEGCVLHMVLNEAPLPGRPLRVRRVDDGAILTISCTPDFCIAEVKHELACCPPGGRPRSQMRLAFAGRELEDSHTLREYNIQKDSNVLILLAESKKGRDLRNFVSAMAPQRDAVGVACDSRVGIHFTRVLQDESHFWGQMLGSPDLRSLTLKDFQVSRKSGDGAEAPIQGTLEYADEARTVYFTPAAPLEPCSHYHVAINTSPDPRPQVFFDPCYGLNAYAPTTPPHGGIQVRS